MSVRNHVEVIADIVIHANLFPLLISGIRPVRLANQAHRSGIHHSSLRQYREQLQRIADARFGGEVHSKD